MASKDPLSGHPGHLDQAQESALLQFRQELESEGLAPSGEARTALAQRLGYDRNDDQTLLRFLRARKFDLPKAKLMWAENEKWRKEPGGADDIAANGFEYPEQAQVNQYYPQYYHRTDRDGRPIYIEQLGKLDIPKLYALTTQDRQLKHLVYEYERFFRDRLPACSQHTGGLVETSCTIMDLHNAGLSSFYKVKDYVSAASSIGQNHYPETMGHMFIVNAPYLFSTVWSLIKGWLDEATVRKIHILGKSYKTEITKYIDPANLPTDLGGSCTCQQAGGNCQMSDAGPWNTGGI